MAEIKSPRTLQEAIVHFNDPKVCEEALVAARWPRGVQCPTCHSFKVRRLETQKRWECSNKHPRRQFSAKKGTIFEDSPIKLSKWFVAIWLISAAKNGVSSYELSRSIGITQKSAWFMLHRIRLAMQAGSFGKKFDGVIEADETFIGGKSRNMHASRKLGRGRHGKVAVMALLQRYGRDGEGHSIVTAKVVPSVRRRVLQSHMRERIVMDGKTTVYSDALKSYEPVNPRGWKPSDLYIHEFIDHAETYVNGQVHTNGCENFWSLLKRGLRGTYVSVEPFHVFRYVDEQVYRFNSRKMTDADRFDELTERVVGKRLTYAELTGSATEQSA
jgi:transposase-like protein